MISVVILTKNEEQDLPKCLESLRWCDDVHVVDSGSTDKTMEIARKFGAKISENPFVSFGTQRNWCLDNCIIKHPWILFFDADEVANKEFTEAMTQAVAAAPASTAGFYCCWKLIYQDRWLKRCDNFPKWQLRLIRKGHARFIDFGHGQKEGEVKGSLEYLRTPYDHHALSKGIGPWLDRHNRYATQEAAVRLVAPIKWREAFSANGSKRNKALKPIVSRVPGWPLIRFLITYVAMLGFLEGRPGFVYCANLAYYEFLIRIKMREQALQASNDKP
jgi:glycosyltransferase involved in cell wall biosynthesis